MKTRCPHALAIYRTLACLVLGLAAVSAHAQPGGDPSGIDFVAIGNAGNQPYRTANPNDFVNGRGGVDYEYRIGRMEVTSAQWLDFFNAAFDRPAGDRLPHLIPPEFWGGVPATPINAGGRRWTVPAANANLPAGDISWRMAAMYCNWLHNDKRTDRDAFLSGAYDVSTFGFNGNIFTDQAAHSPGARYWIPTWDEWLKAAHYDPTKPNPDGSVGGWWTYSNGSDIAFTYGPPGSGAANAGFDAPNPFAIPLGSYGVTSPYGLLDVAGGTTEWTESIRTINTGEKYRVHDGSFWTEDSFEAGLLDRTREWGGELPHIADYWYGLRLASSVPSPAAATVFGLCGMVCVARRRRSITCNSAPSSHSPSRF